MGRHVLQQAGFPVAGVQEEEEEDKRTGFANHCLHVFAASLESYSSLALESIMCRAGATDQDARMKDGGGGGGYSARD